MNTQLTARFPSREDAEKAMQQLKDQGISYTLSAFRQVTDDVNRIMSFQDISSTGAGYMALPTMPFAAGKYGKTGSTLMQICVDAVSVPRAKSILSGAQGRNIREGRPT